MLPSISERDRERPPKCVRKWSVMCVGWSCGVVVDEAALHKCTSRPAAIDAKLRPPMTSGASSDFLEPSKIIEQSSQPLRKHPSRPFSASKYRQNEAERQEYPLFES